MAPKHFSDHCCNPFEIVNHVKTNNLRKVCTSLQLKHSLDPDVRLCCACLKKLRNCDAIIKSSNESVVINDFERQQSVDSKVAVTSETPKHDITSSTTDSQSSISEQKLSQQLSGLSLEYTFPEINQALELLNLKPIYPHQFDDKVFLNQKADEVASTLKKKFGVNLNNELLHQVNSNDTVEIIQKLKDKFNDKETTRVEKIQILTILPSKWTVSQTLEIMNSTEYMLKCAKNLEETQGVLSKPGVKSGNPLSKQTESAVLKFHEDDEISAPMPGMKDCISLQNDEGQKIKIQKRLILSYSKELHSLFKKRNPTLKIGFSKFADLRPKYCVLAGGSGTHTVCVCSIHQNVKLMMLGRKKGCF